MRFNAPWATVVKVVTAVACAVLLYADPARSVVLDYGERKIVVTPDRPEEFLRQLEAWQGPLASQPPAAGRG